MPSPFPGMNPYLEQDDVWQDFHDSMIPAMRDALVPRVGADYVVKIEQHIYIHEPSAEYRILIGRSEVSLARPTVAKESHGATATIASPMMARVPNVDFEKHLYLELRDKKNRDLVTILEMLSPTNKKPGADREQYLAKRANLLRSAANFVEIDLLRGWPKMPIDNAKECDYSIIVSRVEDRPDLNYWPLSLRDPLPKIPIPLRSPHPPVELDLKAVLEGVCDRAAYGQYIYKDSPSPPLNPEDAAWAAAILASQA